MEKCICLRVGMCLCVCGVRVTVFFMFAHLTGVKLTPVEEEDLRKRWQHAVGPRFEVIVCLSVIKTCISYKKSIA